MVSDVKLFNFSVAATLVLSQFHLFRNISIVLLIPYGVSLIIVYALSIGKRVSERFIGFYLFFLLVPLILSFASYLIGDDWGDPFIGVSRYFYSSLLFYCFFIENIDHRKLFGLFLIFGIISALTLPFQFYFGPVSWFAEPGERAGLVRYSTLMGSLTVFGGVVGPLLLLNYYLLPDSKWLRPIVSLVLVGASFLSLQKSGFLSLFFSVLLLIFYKRIGFRDILFFIVLGVVILGNLSQDLINGLTNLFLNMLGNVDDEYKSDDTIFESLLVRVFDRPLESFEYFGVFRLIVGVGFYGAAGGLGYSELPMMHNLFGEVLAVYGLLGFIFFLCLIYFFMMKNFAINELKIWGESSVYFWILSMTFGSSLFAGGLFFHPFTGGIFFLTVAAVLKRNNRKFNS